MQILFRVFRLSHLLKWWISSCIVLVHKHDVRLNIIVYYLSVSCGITQDMFGYVQVHRTQRPVHHQSLEAILIALYKIRLVLLRFFELYVVVATHYIIIIIIIIIISIIIIVPLLAQSHNVNNGFIWGSEEVR